MTIIALQLIEPNVAAESIPMEDLAHVARRECERYRESALPGLIATIRYKGDTP